MVVVKCVSPWLYEVNGKPVPVPDWNNCTTTLTNEEIKALCAMVNSNNRKIE
jgi:hypothetical protein